MCCCWCIVFFLKIRRQTSSTLTDSLFPYTTRYRSHVAAIRHPRRPEEVIALLAEPRKVAPTEVVQPDGGRSARRIADGGGDSGAIGRKRRPHEDRKSTRRNSSH